MYKVRKKDIFSDFSLNSNFFARFNNTGNFIDLEIQRSFGWANSRSGARLASLSVYMCDSKEFNVLTFGHINFRCLSLVCIIALSLRAWFHRHGWLRKIPRQ